MRKFSLPLTALAVLLTVPLLVRAEKSRATFVYDDVATQVTLARGNASQLWITTYFGQRADQREGLSSLQAPDFTLPDMAGKMHSLSDFRGKKVLLVTWASW